MRCCMKAKAERKMKMKHRLKMRTHDSPRKGVATFTEDVHMEYLGRLLKKIEVCSYTKNITTKEVEKQLRSWKRERTKTWNEIGWYQTAITRLLDRRDADQKNFPNLPAKDWDGNKELVGMRSVLKSLQGYHNYEVMTFLVYTKQLLKMKKDK